MTIQVPRVVDPGRTEVTQLLAAAGKGDREAIRSLLPLLYDELHALAHRQRMRRRGPSTLNTTALVHEAYLKLVRADGSFHDRQHFFRVAAMAMRQILVDYARGRLAEKRGAGAVMVDIDDVSPAAGSNAEEVLALDAALEKLARLSPRQAEVVTMRFFAGFTIPETAELLACSPATVTRDWAAAQAWLQQELG